MPDIHIHRPHALGLTEARRIAAQWADEARGRFGMDCTLLDSGDTDTMAFARPGVRGTLTVAADRFDLHATLGLLLGAFSGAIRAEIEKNLDAMLGGDSAAAPPSRVPRDG